MAQKKYLDLTGLQKFAASLLSKFALKNHNHDNSYAPKSHTHTTAQVTGLDAALAGKAPVSHTHTIANITNLQTSLDGKVPTTRTVNGKALSANITLTPADVKADAAGSATNALNSSKQYTDTVAAGKAPTSHNHAASNITSGTLAADRLPVVPIAKGGTGATSVNGIRSAIGANPITTAGTGSAYTATVPHITSLTAGVGFTMIPNVVSTAVAPTLNVNNLGAKPIRQRLSNSTVSTAPGSEADWLAAGKPVNVMYDGASWVVDFVRPNMASAYGVLPVANGGTGANSAAQARTNLGITPANIGAAASSHTHTTAQVTGLDSALAGKAPSSHSHTMSQITGLDSKISEFDSNIAELYRTKAKATHQHSAGDITSGVLAVNRGGTGANNTMDAAYALRVPRCHTGAKLVLIWGMTVIRLNPDYTQNIESFSSLTNKCGFSVGRYNCSIFFNTSDFAACPTIHSAYTSVDSIGVQATAGNQARVNYVIACWQ